MTIEEIDRLTAMGKKIKARMQDLPHDSQARKDFTMRTIHYLRNLDTWTEEMINEMRAWMITMHKRTHRRGSPGRKEPAKHAGHGAQKQRKDEDG